MTSTNPTIYIDLFGRTFENPPLGKWYNLQTGKLVSKGQKGSIIIHQPRVMGPEAMIDQFLVRNQLPPRKTLLQQIQGLKVNQESFTKPTQPPIGTASGAVPQLVPIPKSPPRFGGPPQIVAPEAKRRPLAGDPGYKWVPQPQQEAAFPGGFCTPGGTALYRLQTTDIESIPVDVLDTLCNFTLLGLRVKARVLDVIDGDTIDIAFFLPTTFLTQSHLQGRGKDVRVVQAGLVFEGDRGFVVRYRCRLNGIDAAEKETAQGQKATQLTREKYASLGNIIYVLTTGMDKYGRLLIEAYEDPQYQRGLNRFLIGYQDPILGVLAVAYGGGTKSEYMKQLPKAEPRK